MVLQAFFDDSGSSANEPFYVLAGFAAEGDAWKLFAEQWSACLAENNLHYFKMREAAHLDGEFAMGWNASRRDAVVYQLAEIIAAHAEFSFSAFVKRSHFDSIMVGAALDADDYADPYAMLFWSISRQVFERQFVTGDKRPADLIFDEQGAIGLQALQWWPSWKNWIHPDRRHLIGSPPKFENDIIVNPLQAADLLAWTVRFRLCGGTEQRWQAEAVEKAFEPIEYFEMHWDKERLLEIRANQTLLLASMRGD